MFGVLGGLALRIFMVLVSIFCLEGESGERLGLIIDFVVFVFNIEDFGLDLIYVFIGKG